ncbi:MAG: T9SS type A sorting domain-containing protein, partial [Flavobacteriales bacterium]
RHSYCGRASGYAIAMVSGGLPPYTFQWSNGSTGSSAEELGPGNHSVTVTDAQAEQATANFTIVLQPYYDNALESSWPKPLANRPGDPKLVAVYSGMESAGFNPPVGGYYGPNPYLFNHPDFLGSELVALCSNTQNAVYNLLTFADPPTAPGTPISFSDANGCPGNHEFAPAPSLSTFPVVQVLNTVPSCSGANQGSVTFSWQGQLPYQYAVYLKPFGSAITACQTTQAVLGGGTAPGGIQTFSGLVPGEYWLVTTNDYLGVLVATPYEYRDSMLVAIGNLGTDCGPVSGRVYVDETPDCAMAFFENKVPDCIVEVTPGPLYVTTDQSGQYSISLPPGSYTFAEQHPVLAQSCPGDAAVAAGVPSTLNVGCAGGVPLDVQVAMADGFARPGFEMRYGVMVRNLTPSATGTVTLTVTLDPNLSYVTASPAPATVAGNTLTWTSPGFFMNQAFQTRNIWIRALVPADLSLLGATLTSTATLVTANADADLANNTAVANQVVTGSYDPNDKAAVTTTGGSAVYLIDQDEWIDYTIRFQNTGTDTAFNVIITDTLPPALDPASIQWGAASHPHLRELAGQGVLRFSFPNILLPDSGVSEPLSHGFVSFRIRPHLPLAPGTVIENTANIYFDYNPPVITDPSVLVAEFSTGVMEGGGFDPRIVPNPGRERFAVVHSGRFTFRVLDALGREVQNPTAASDQATVDALNWPAGAYLVQVSFPDAPPATLRWVKH